ncbi:28S ribosomal protein S10, mitochondrial isoform X1 [Falco biarmicus]|uniref:28S ribosomal protein S10, mitochondrial isoform X1 n=3 Tax=Falco TaxID=8952 RepID=UPI000FFC745E|nr:28S ribosomal protein S10, mitochondrial isoform X1 [Falco biarmicus]
MPQCPRLSGGCLIRHGGGGARLSPGFSGGKGWRMRPLFFRAVRYGQRVEARWRRVGFVGGSVRWGVWLEKGRGSPFSVNYASRIMQKQCFLLNSGSMGARLAGSHVDAQEPKTNPLITISDEPETLYKRLSLLVKGHDKAVLDSYEYFAVLAAEELGISVEKVHKPPKKIERLTLLKSVHIYKKHRVQYEMRTHYMCLELKYLTSSTAAVYLEYVQRNLPEGVAMEVKKTKIEKIPEHIQEPVWDTRPQVEETEVKS